MKENVSSYSFMGGVAEGRRLPAINGDEIGVFGGIPGEHVVAEVLRRRDRVSARVMEVLSPSPQ